MLSSVLIFTQCRSSLRNVLIVGCLVFTVQIDTATFLKIIKMGNFIALKVNLSLKCVYVSLWLSALKSQSPVKHL